MKSKVTILLLIAVCTVARGQLTLNTRDRCTCPFGATNFILFPGGPGSFQPVFGEALIRLEETSLPPGTALRIELFENRSAERPIGTTWITDTNPNPSAVACDVDNAWHDLQGVVRLTMVSGSITLHSVSLQVGRFSDGQYQRWQGGLPLQSIRIDPRLNITRLSSTEVQMTWPTNDTAFGLEQTQTLPAPAWSPVTNSVGRTGGQTSVIVATDQPQEVFRLSKP